jgi:hypothetical protein
MGRGMGVTGSGKVRRERDMKMMRGDMGTQMKGSMEMGIQIR